MPAGNTATIVQHDASSDMGSGMYSTDGAITVTNSVITQNTTQDRPMI